jgi:hypothetical protein
MYVRMFGRGRSSGMSHTAQYIDTTSTQGIFEKYSTRFSCLKWDLNIAKSCIFLTIL